MGTITMHVNIFVFRQDTREARLRRADVMSLLGEIGLESGGCSWLCVVEIT